MNIHLRGGKTAPRLLHDLRSYDPRKPPPHGFNILTDIPLHDEEQKKPPPPAVGKGSCRHEWSLKHNQCSPSLEEEPPEETLLFIIAAYCAQCRSHLEVLLDFREGDNFYPRCPNEESPLHHFVHKPEASSPRQPGTTFTGLNHDLAWVDTQAFCCSSTPCYAKLQIRIKPPRLIPDWVTQLSDPFVIRTRAEKAIASDPERFEGHGVPMPIQVLQSTNAYIFNAMNDQGIKKRIQGKNKRFMLNLGEPCADLLEYIGFSREGEDWLPPQPEPSTSIPFTNPGNIRLDDIEKELHVLISKRPEDEKRIVKYQYIPRSAMDDMKRILGSSDYRKSLRSRTIDLTKQEHPFYAGLGSIEDFHDDLITFAYDRQILTDPDNTPYYLECLQGIAAGRNSEDLRTKAAIEASSDKISFSDIRAAFKSLGLTAEAPHGDDTIIGIFKSRIADAPKQEDELRRALKIIGQTRESQKIQVVASQVVTNYEQALSFLGAEPNTSDEFISTMFTIKINDRPADQHTARHAISLIANHRNSQALRNFLETGTLGEVEMDVNTAYALLDIHDKAVEDDLILTTYNVRISDNPSQLDSLKNAVTVIAKARNSRRLGDFVNTGMISSEYELSEWPVGLENIGNTCYLNSLLQFYFTIKPLRDLVMNIDEFKMPVDEESLRSKRVGSRTVSKKEVTRAQQFVDELRRLFQSMITSSKASVTPEGQLARLTLVSSSKEDHIRRQSMLSPARPSLGEIHGEPVYGPLGPPADAVHNDSEMADDVEANSSEVNTVQGEYDHDVDSSSDVTLVDGLALPDNDLMVLDKKEKSLQQRAFEDKENLPPSKGSFRESSPEMHLVPLGESSPSRVNEQQGVSVASKENVKESIDPTNDEQDSPSTVAETLNTQMTSAAAGPPNRPPPYPPRPTPIDTSAVLEAEIGAQQDVTEVIANVLFQLQCAIKADNVDESGEQLDQVKDLFFGKQKSYTRNNKGAIRTKEEYMSDIKVDVASGSRDIYAALDGAYDVQEVEVGGGVEPQYTSISRLPPVLQIHVQRVQFNLTTRSSFKSNNHLQLKETIYMDRYMDSDDPELLERRQQCWQWKKQLLRLENRREQLANSDLGMDMPEILKATQAYLQNLTELDDEDSIEVPPTLIQGIEDAAREAKAELESIESQINDLNSSISSQFNDLRKIPYRLQSVFIHRGYHNSGHYWIYIYDFAKEMWRKYNDGYVTEVKEVNEIFVQEAGDRPATPYFLVYVKDEFREQLVDPVCRDPAVEEPPKETQDVEMQDYSRPAELEAQVTSYAPYVPENGATESYQNQEWPSGEGWNNRTAAGHSW